MTDRVVHMRTAFLDGARIASIGVVTWNYLIVFVLVGAKFESISQPTND